MSLTIDKPKFTVPVIIFYLKKVIMLIVILGYVHSNKNKLITDSHIYINLESSNWK